LSYLSLLRLELRPWLIRFGTQLFYLLHCILCELLIVGAIEKGKIPLMHSLFLSALVVMA
jgi:hypothetical protein